MSDAYHAIKDPLFYAGHTYLVYILGPMDFVRKIQTQTMSRSDKKEADLTFCQVVERNGFICNNYQH